MKQADVVLLGYPVPFSLNPQVRRRNLEMYEAVTSPQGPAMTWVRWVVVPSGPSPAHRPLAVDLTPACPPTSDCRACLPWAGWS